MSVSHRSPRGARLSGDHRRRLHAHSREQHLPDEPSGRGAAPAQGAYEPRFLVGEVPWEEASRYGVCDTNQYGEITDVVEKPDDPPSNLVMTGFYTFTPAIFHACHLVQPSNGDEYEISDAIDLLSQSGRTIDAIGLDGWRIDVGYPEDRDEAERRLREDTEGDNDTQDPVESDA